MAGPGQVVLIARAMAQPGREEAMQQALVENAEASRREPGCVSYWLLRGENGLFIAVERWRSRVDVDQHMAAPHVQTLMQTITPLLAAPPVIETLEEI